MSEQRIDSGADAASSTSADPTEGQGLGTAGSHPGGLLSGPAGDSADQTVPQPADSAPDSAPGAAPGDDADPPDTEGARFLSEATSQARSEQT